MARAIEPNHSQTEQRQEQQHRLQTSATCIRRDADQALNEIHNDLTSRQAIACRLKTPRNFTRVGTSRVGHFNSWSLVMKASGAFQGSCCFWDWRKFAEKNLALSGQHQPQVSLPFASVNALSFEHVSVLSRCGRFYVALCAADLLAHAPPCAPARNGPRPDTPSHGNCVDGPG